MLRCLAQAFAAASSASDEGSFAAWLRGMGLITEDGYQSMKRRFDLRRSTVLQPGHCT